MEFNAPKMTLVKLNAAGMTSAMGSELQKAQHNQVVGGGARVGCG